MIESECVHMEETPVTERTTLSKYLSQLTTHNKDAISSASKIFPRVCFKKMDHLHRVDKLFTVKFISKLISGGY